MPEQAHRGHPSGCPPTRRHFLFLALIPPPRQFRLLFCRTAEEIAWAAPAARPKEITDCSSYLRYCYQQAANERGNTFQIGAGKKAEFADAEHLMRHNCTYISHDLSSAQPADLFFFKQLEPRQPWHAMIYLGSSLVQPADQKKYLVYHTGPTGNDPGEIRRPATDELLRHPEPRWRPLPGNRNFLGVFRWNILI